MKAQLSAELLLALSAFLAALFLLSSSLARASHQSQGAYALLQSHSQALWLSLEAEELAFSCRNCAPSLPKSNCSASNASIRCGGAFAPTMGEIEGTGGFLIHASQYEPA